MTTLRGELDINRIRLDDEDVRSAIARQVRVTLLRGLRPRARREVLDVASEDPRAKLTVEHDAEHCSRVRMGVEPAVWWEPRLDDVERGRLDVKEARTPQGHGSVPSSRGHGCTMPQQTRTEPSKRYKTLSVQLNMIGLFANIRPSPGDSHAHPASDPANPGSLQCGIVHVTKRPD